MENIEFEGYEIRGSLNREVLACARLYKGLPQGITKPFELLKPIERLGRAAGFNHMHICFLQYLMKHTLIQDWSENSRPVVFKSRAVIAKELQLSTRQVCRLERQLHNLGVLVWHDTANFHRMGYRNREGMLEDAYGVDLSPLAVRYEYFKQKADEMEKEQRAWKKTRTKVAALRKEIAALLYRVSLQEGAEKHAKEMESITAVFEELKVRITESTPLSLLSKLYQSLRALKAQLSKVSALWTTEEMQPKMSHAQDIYVRPNNTELQSDILLTKNTCNPPVDNKLRDAHASQKNESQFVAGYASTGSKDNRKKSWGGDFLQNTDKQPVISAEMAYQVASEDFRDCLPKTGSIGWSDIIRATGTYAGWLGIHETAWQDACMKMGTADAALCVIIADRRNKMGQVKSPGGFLRGCIKKALSGDLHLGKSVFGLLQKQEKSNEYYLFS